MDLRWHRYRYYPYERELALREVGSLLAPREIEETKHGLRLKGVVENSEAHRLVYFAEALEGEIATPTLQLKLEQVNGNGIGRQSTRYSAHGLHEYKGKFNPQIVRAILNLFKVSSGARVIDPFCGSGTSLVECAHSGVEAIGTDVNPLAVFVANAKIAALRLPVSRLRWGLTAALGRYKGSRRPGTKVDERRAYLERWFDPSALDQIERLRIAIQSGDSKCGPALLSIASNLLREYSLQDPADLRIRRRKTPIPEAPFIEAFEAAAETFISRVDHAKRVLPIRPVRPKALLLDSRRLKNGHKELGSAKFDCALTSPPYATALPYIDTQRLSLVWLDLLPPSLILDLEASLIGSREVRGERKNELLSILMENRRGLPNAQAAYCQMLQGSLSDHDGFRRQAVPLLLYRYFSGMAEVFNSVRSCVNAGAPFALIVGGNHTVLGGHRFEIDTPLHLSGIARVCGWACVEIMPLQTYQRYGYHMSNSVSSEALVILKAS